MIPVIGLVVCGYVLVRMIEPFTKHETNEVVRIISVFVAVGSVIAGYIIISDAVAVSGALGPSPSTGRTYQMGDTTFVITDTTLALP